MISLQVGLPPRSSRVNSSLVIGFCFRSAEHSPSALHTSLLQLKLAVDRKRGRSSRARVDDRNVDEMDRLRLCLDLCPATDTAESYSAFNRKSDSLT